MATQGRGWNSKYGFDMGPPPPGFGPAQPNRIPQFPSFSPQQTFGFGWPQASFPPPPPAYATFPPQYPSYPFPQTQGQFPAPPPITDGGIPGTHLKNHTGGVGLPPGYNYLFPKKHCTIHLIKSKDPPWQIPFNKHDPTTHTRHYVPTTVTVKELMQQSGCNNPDASKNKLVEIVESGAGQWKSGLRLQGDNKDKMKLAISELGWDEKRTGNVMAGERPVVWIWLTKG